MCVFYNSKYIHLLELLFLSLRIFSPSDSFDLLILTSDDFQAKIRELADRLEIRCNIHCIPCTSIFEAACSRLHVFDWPEIERYKKILYLDTDIILRRDISSLFLFELDDILYGIPSGTLKSPHFGGQFFDFTTIDSSTPGLNSGTILFTPSKPVRELFFKIIHLHLNIKWTYAPKT
jgi:alpha-N-acetylglucosamine transferase